MEYFALTLFESLNFDQFKDLHGKSLLDCTNESEAIEYIGKKGKATDLMVQILVDDECTTTLRRCKPKIQFSRPKDSSSPLPSSGELKLHALYLGKNKEMTDWHWVTYRPQFKSVTGSKKKKLIFDVVKPIPGHPKGCSKCNMWLIIDFQNGRGVGVINQQFTFDAQTRVHPNKTKQRKPKATTNKRKSMDDDADNADYETADENENSDQTESSHKKCKPSPVTASSNEIAPVVVQTNDWNIGTEISNAAVNSTTCGSQQFLPEYVWMVQKIQHLENGLKWHQYLLDGLFGLYGIPIYIIQQPFVQHMASQSATQQTSTCHISPPSTGVPNNIEPNPFASLPVQCSQATNEQLNQALLQEHAEGSANNPLKTYTPLETADILNFFESKSGQELLNEYSEC